MQVAVLLRRTMCIIAEAHRDLGAYALIVSCRMLYHAHPLRFLDVDGMRRRIEELECEAVLHMSAISMYALAGVTAVVLNMVLQRSP
jgi:hypothetical protein